MYATLLDVLPTTRDSDRPWLVCYGPRQRTELTGHVLAMWHAKTAGLITSESPASPAQPPGPSTVHVGTGVHWRGVTWACGAWLAGRQVLTGRGSDVEAAGLAPGTSVALQPEELCPAAEVQVLVPRQDLAARWPGELPPLVLDGAADLMAYPDTFQPVAQPVAAPGTVCLTEVSREAGLRSHGAADLLTGPQRPGHQVSGEDSGSPGRARRQRAVVVREQDLAAALRGVLAAWAAGMTAVLLTEDADDDVAEAAARQEGASLRR